MNQPNQNITTLKKVIQSGALSIKLLVQIFNDNIKKNEDEKKTISYVIRKLNLC